MVVVNWSPSPLRSRTRALADLWPLLAIAAPCGLIFADEFGEVREQMVGDVDLVGVRQRIRDASGHVEAVLDTGGLRSAQVEQVEIPTDGAGNRTGLVPGLDLTPLGLQFIDRAGRPIGELRTGRLDLAVGVAERQKRRGLAGDDLSIGRPELLRRRVPGRLGADGYRVGRRGGGERQAIFEGFNNRPDLPTAPVVTKMRAMSRPDCRQWRTGSGSSGHEIASLGNAVARRRNP